MNGEISLFNLDEGCEHDFSDAVEFLWVTLINEVPWLDYSHCGAQVSSANFALFTALSSIEGSDNASIKNVGVELITLAYSTLKTTGQM